MCTQDLSLRVDTLNAFEICLPAGPDTRGDRQKDISLKVILPTRPLFVNSRESERINPSRIPSETGCQLHP